MKILMLYFTGTYNTRYISKLIADKFSDYGHEIDFIEIDADAPSNLNTSSYDLVGLGYPIYAFNSPAPFNKYLKRVSFKEGQKYFIYKNSGETFKLNNSSSRIIKRVMNKRKTELAGEYHFIMPYNIHFPFDRDFIKELLILDDKLADVLVYNIINNRIKVINGGLINNLLSKIISVQKIGGAVNSLFYKTDKNKCTLCGKCVNACPKKNIFIKDGKIKFKLSCAMCMRCSFYCPSDAIKIGLLNKWKVNGDYKLNEIRQEELPQKPYITDEAKGFYRCFIKSYDEVNKAYDEVERLKRESLM